MTMSGPARVVRILGYAFAILGVVLLGIAIAIGVHNMRAGQGMVPAVGTVTAVETLRPTISFDAGGKAVSVVGPVAPGYGVGEKLKLLHDPADPQRIVVDEGRWQSTSLFGAVGLVFAVLGFGFLTVSARQGRRLAWLRRNGQKAEGRIVEIAPDKTVQINGRPSWKIVVEWRAGTSSHRAVRRVVRDPRPALGGRDMVVVWFEPGNPKNCWIDLEALDDKGAA
jgi:hypothetical protein